MNTAAIDDIIKNISGKPYVTLPTAELVELLLEVKRVLQMDLKVSNEPDLVEEK